MKKKINIINKKAKFEYLLHDSYVAGIVLTGPEIKSIRNSKVSIRESFCKFQNNELFIINMNIDTNTENNTDANANANTNTNTNTDTNLKSTPPGDTSV